MVTETETIEFLPKPPDIDVILRKIRSEVAQQKNESKLFLREQFATTKPGNSGLNPLILLPREMWSAILNKITSPKDTWNCYQTCNLFQNLIPANPAELLFHQIFPLVQNYLDQKDYLKCRLVCQTWKKGLDSCIETLALQEILCFHRTYYNFSIGVHQAIWPVRRAMKQHGKNPFVGNAVALGFWYPWGERVYYTNELNEEVESFLKVLGKYIHILRISGSSLTIPSNDPCILVSTILNHCPYLRKLEMNGVSVAINSITDNLPIFYCEQQSQLPDHSALEYLSMVADTYLQAHLLEKYHSQLKYLKIGSWHGFDYNWDWNNLETLVLDFAAPDIEILQNFKAQHLRNMKLLRNTRTIRFCVLAKTLRGFPNLSTLHIRLGSNSLLSPEEAFSSEVDQLCFLSVEEIKLIIPHQDSQLSYDFLVFFPLLKLLTINIEHNSERLNETETDFRNGEEKVLKIFWRLRAATPPNWEGQDKKSMYRSNIWSVLSDLNTIVVEYESPFYAKYLYTRVGFEKFDNKMDWWHCFSFKAKRWYYEFSYVIVIALFLLLIRGIVLIYMSSKMN